MTEYNLTPQVVTIAGSDSGGGAGMQADLKTFQARQAFGLNIVIALTAQIRMACKIAYRFLVHLLMHNFNHWRLILKLGQRKRGC